MLGLHTLVWSSASEVSISGRGSLFCRAPGLSRHRIVKSGGNRQSEEKSFDNHEGDSQRSEREEGRLSLFTFAFIVTNFTPAKAKAHLANRPDLEPCRGMKSSESGTPGAIPSFTNSDPSSWIQEAGHQGARAPAPALGVPRSSHLHTECSSVPPCHLGHQVTQ